MKTTNEVNLETIQTIGTKPMENYLIGISKNGQ